ncbi:MAG: restriction endonuclease subunit S [Pseudomonadota bacterium]
MVPEGWVHTSLGDLLEFKNGYNTEKANYGGGVPFINVSEVLKHESLTADLIPGSVKLNEAAAKAYRVNRGDILFNRTSETTDEVGFTSVYLDKEPVIFGGFVIRGRPRNGSLFPEFARYAMRQPQVRSEIIRRSQGAVRSNVGQGELSKVAITLPPLPEQRKIADILSTWDAAIEKTETLLATARTQKRALMQSLLTGRRRFPEFEDQPWKEVRLGELLTSMDAGCSVNSSDRGAAEEECGVLKTSCVSGGIFEWRNNKAVLEAAEVQRLKEPVLAGTVIMSRMNTSALVGANGYVSRDYPNLFLPDRLWALKSDPSLVLPRWLGHILSSRPVRYRLSSLATGTSGSMKNITKDDVRSLPVLLPSLDEQAAIDAALHSWDLEADKLLSLTVQMRSEKKALMQQLLTGKRRVAV